MGTIKQFGFKEAVSIAEVRIIETALLKVKNNKRKAADLLGIDRKTIYNKLKQKVNQKITSDMTFTKVKSVQKVPGEMQSTVVVTLAITDKSVNNLDGTEPEIKLVFTEPEALHLMEEIKEQTGN